MNALRQARSRIGRVVDRGVGFVAALGEVHMQRHGMSGLQVGSTDDFSRYDQEQIK